MRGWIKRVGLRGTLAAIRKVVVEKMQHDIHTNIVEHEACDHFTRTELHLEQRGNEHDDAAEHRRNQHTDHRVQARVHVEVNARQRGDEAARHDDALAREVKLVARKHHADRKAGENRRNHRSKNVIKALCVKACHSALDGDQRSNQQIPQRGQRLVRTQKDEDRTDAEREQDCGGAAHQLKAKHSSIFHDTPSRSPHRSAA
ncbi:hypothetical protein SDC9_134129 [bioreactor metagenome]|uniref:Uncharacterized protein n=1 Tax=bioreactor metagenome TaxID=1076179 RepID=A0A645DCE4_9ZZZZ